MATPPERKDGKKPNRVTEFIDVIRRLPIAEFYTYLWQTDRPLLGTTVFVNYLLPVILEGMPWYLSRRKISKQLRDDRNAIQYRLIKAEPFSLASVTSFVVMSIVYAVLHTFEQILRNRVDLANRMVVKRLMMERILYSEVGSLQARCLEVFQEEVRTDQLDVRILNDITQTLHLFNSIIPTLFRGSFTFAASAYDLYKQKGRIDPLAILRPTVVGFLGELFDLIRTRFVTDVQALQLQRNEAAMSREVSNIVDGLVDIQVNNMQDHQLGMLDRVILQELDTRQGWTTYLDRVYRQTSNRSVFDFATEVYVVSWVMKRRGLDHETYRQVQNDIDYVTRLFGRMYTQARMGYEILSTQYRVAALLNLPNFLHEKSAARLLASHRLDLKTLTVQRVRFAYKPDAPHVLDIQAKRPEDAIEIKRGKIYAVVGQNRAGKSTLLQILCKLYQPEAGSEIQFNGQPFESIPRIQLRQILSYVAQRPFLFPGTIEANIRMGSNVPLSEVEAAADAAGVFLVSSGTQQPGTEQRQQESVFAERSEVKVKPWEQNYLKDWTVRVAGWARNLWQNQLSLAPLQGPSEAQSVPGDRSTARLASRHHPEVYANADQGQDEKLLPSVSARASDHQCKSSRDCAVCRYEQFKSRAAAGTLLVDDAEGPGAATLHLSRPAEGRQLTSWSAFAAPDTQQSLSVDARARETVDRQPLFRQSELKQPVLNQPQPQQHQQQPQASGSSSASSEHPILGMELEARGANISGGFAQSVALARVFLRKEAQVVILDEAVGQMDAIKKREFILPNLFRFVRQHNMTLIIVTHEVASVCPLVDHVFVMDRGRLVQQGDHAKLIQEEGLPYSRLCGV